MTTRHDDAHDHSRVRDHCPRCGRFGLGCHEGASADPVERFWETVERTEGCWLWTGGQRGGGPGRGEPYGRFEVFGKGISAHRFSWELAHGPIPDGMSILHNCDTPLCVRPDHLRIGTHEENMADRSKRGRVAVGERNGKSKLTVDQVREIRRMRQAGLYAREISEELGVGQRGVENVLAGRTWRWLP